MSLLELPLEFLLEQLSSCPLELSVGASVGVPVGTAVGTVVGAAVGVAVGPTAFEGTVFSNFVNRFISERADLRIKSE